MALAEEDNRDHSAERARPRSGIDLDTDTPETMTPAHDMVDDAQPSVPWSENLARAKAFIDPIVQKIADGAINFTKDGPFTVGTMLWGFEQLIVEGSHAAGPYAKLALGGAIGTLLQRYIKKHPRFESKLAELYVVGAEAQMTGMIASSELISRAQGQPLSPEAFGLILLTYADEGLYELMHRLVTFNGKFDLGSQQITRGGVAFFTLAYAIHAAQRVESLGRPEEAYIILAAACLNLGEVLMTLLDRDTIHADALKRQSINFAQRALHDHSVALEAFGKTFKAAMIERKKPFYHQKRKLEHLEMRAMIWSEIAGKVSAFIDRSGKDVTREEVEAYTQSVFDQWLNPRVIRRDASFKHALLHRHNADPVQLRFDVTQFGYPVEHIELETYDGLPPHVDTMLRRDMKAFLRAARKQANWTTPEGWKEEFTNFIQFLRYGDNQVSASSVEPQAEPIQEEYIPTQYERTHEPPMTEHEIGWLTFWESVVDQMDDEHDRENFPKVLEIDDPELLRVWLQHLYERYAHLIPTEDEGVE